MTKEERRAGYDSIFESVDPAEKALFDSLIDEVVYYECEMERLKKMPFLSVNPKNPARQKMTAAARLYKEYATSYMNALRILLNVLRKVETSAQDELLKRLGEFM